MPANVDLSADPLIEQSAEAMSTMESEAAEYFAQRDSERAAKALNPVAPALEKAAAAPAKSAPKAAPAPAAPAAPKKAPEVIKVSGPPVLNKPAAKVEPPKADPAAAPTEPAAETATDFADIPRDFKAGTIRAAGWAKLHAKSDHFEALARQHESELQAARAELEAARIARSNGTPTGEVATRLQTLQQERDALQARLEAVAVERSPRFEAQFKPRRDAAIAQAKSVVSPADAQTLNDIISMPESAYRDEKVEALLSTLPPLRASKLVGAIADLDRLSAERQQLASQGSDLYKAWMSEEQSKRERENAERMTRANSTFDAEIKEWAPVGLTPEEIANAKSVYTGKGATLQDMARAALWAAKGPQIAQLANEQQAKIAELEAELTKLRGVQPGVGAAGAGAMPTESADEDDLNTTSYAERIARQSMRAGIRFGT